MMVQLYIKRRTPQSNWMRSRKTLVPFHSRQSNCLLVLFSLLFFPLFLPEHCAGSGSGKLETETTFIVHCQCLTADTELVASVGCSSPFLSAEWDFFFSSAGAGSGPPDPLPTAVGDEQCWVCAVDGVVSPSGRLPPSLTLLSGLHTLNNEPSQSLCSSGSRWRD